MNRSPMKIISVLKSTDQDENDSEKHKQQVISRNLIERKSRSQSLTVHEEKAMPRCQRNETRDHPVGLDGNLKATPDGSDSEKHKQQGTSCNCTKGNSESQALNAHGEKAIAPRQRKAIGGYPVSLGDSLKTTPKKPTKAQQHNRESATMESIYLRRLSNQQKATTKRRKQVKDPKIGL